VLTIKKVDLCIEENGKEHHTKRFELMRRDESTGSIAKLVVRRGQKFKLKVTCNRPFNRERDAMSLIFAVAEEEKPTHGHSTMAIAAVNQSPYDLGSALEWGAAIDEIHGDVLEIFVKPPATTPVTQWKMDFDTKLLDGVGTSSFSLPQAFYVLFNPWCPDDQVFMPGKTIKV
jgi:transglutaminase 1